MAPRRKGPVKKKPPVKARESSDGSSSRSYTSTGSRSSSRSGSDDGSSRSGSSSESEDEDRPCEYKRGGYHPVSAYQAYNSRYRVLSKLGAGAFSTVWLCADEKEQADAGVNVVAMKVCKSKQSVTEQAEDEVALFEKLQERAGDGSDVMGARHVVQMCGHFWQSGPHGRHKCLVFEVMGENLLTLVKHNKYKGLAIPMVRRVARHTLLGLEYIHSRGIVHTDIKLENVLLCRHDQNEMLVEARGTYKAFDKLRNANAIDAGLSKSQKKRAKKKVKDVVTAAATAASKDDIDEDAAESEGLPPMKPPARQRDSFDTLPPDRIFCKLGDFGNGCLLNKKITDDIQTRQYRSPEILLGCDWDATADVWSAACMFFELLTGDFLFDPRSGNGWGRDEDHIALMIELLGDHPPKEWALGGKYAREMFTPAGKLKHIKKLKFWGLREVLHEKYKKKDAEAREVAGLLLPMLAWEPQNRCSASQALAHRWLQPLPHEVGEVFVPGLGAVPTTEQRGPEEDLDAKGSHSVDTEEDLDAKGSHSVDTGNILDDKGSHSGYNAPSVQEAPVGVATEAVLDAPASTSTGEEVLDAKSGPEEILNAKSSCLVNNVPAQLDGDKVPVAVAAEAVLGASAVGEPTPTPHMEKESHADDSDTLRNQENVDSNAPEPGGKKKRNKKANKK